MIRRALGVLLLGSCAALDYFERAIDDRNAFLLRMSTTPEYDALRGRPRFNDLLRRVNLPVR